MLTKNKSSRPIGQILIDAGFMSRNDLARGLKEQKRTNELLGEVLVRMGIVEAAELEAALSLQDHFNRNGAASTAAGIRRTLGFLLLQAGKITDDQLDRALAEQGKTGEKLGNILVHRRLLTEQQLNGVLDFQQNQSSRVPASGPLRLGEILITTGCITRCQLEDALQKQALSRKKIGEVLVDEGYAEPNQIKRGMRIQHMLVTAALIAAITACGGSTGAVETGTDIQESTAAQQDMDTNYLEITSDDYGLLKPNFFYSTDAASFWAMEAALADNVYDPEFKVIFRIDIPKGESMEPPAINKTFSIEDNGPHEKFPGVLLIFNGEKSAYKKVEQGIISFTNDSTLSGDVSAAFDIIMTDYDSSEVPPPEYRIKGSFGFKIGTYGPAVLASAAP